MALGVYDTAVLNKVVDNLKRAQAALLNMVFREVLVSTKEKIYFDMEDGKRRIAPFVHPTMGGKVVQGLGFTTKDFEPAYVKDKRVFDPNKALKRSIGEQLGGSLNPQDRTAANIARELADQQNMLLRRQEVMASEILRTGKVTVDGDGYESVLVDFGRNAAHTVTLAGANRWGQAGIVPLENIEDWSKTMLQNSGAMLNDVVMDTLAWRLFTAEAKTQTYLELRAVSRPSDLKIVQMAEIGLAYQGNVGGVQFWVYSDWYVNDAGTEVNMIPDYTVLLLSDRIMGVRHFGAIRDEESGLQAREMFTKSWVEPDPSVRYMLSQSAPLPVPYRPDASFAVTVN